MSSRTCLRRVAACAAGVLGAVAALPGAAVATGAQEGEAVELRGCLLDVHVLPDSRQRMDRYVPDGYEFAGWTELGGGSALNDPLPAATPTRAQPILFAANCRETTVGGETRPTVMTLAGVTVRRRNAGQDDRLSYGNNEHDVYLHSAHTDNERLAHAMADAGLPAHHVEGMTFTRTASDLAFPGRPPMASSTVEVPWSLGSSDAAFGMWTRPPAIPSNFGPHEHLNSFWHGPAGDPAELRLHFADAVEHYTCRQLPHCNGAWAAAGSPLAEFLGSPERRDGVTYDHEEIAQGSLAIVPAAGSAE